MPAGPPLTALALLAWSSQDIHVDYGNNTLLVPPRLPRPEAVACLLYYADVEQSGGATHFALPGPGELTGYSASAPFNPPNFVAGARGGDGAARADQQAGYRLRGLEHTAHLYASERPVRYKPGTCILCKSHGRPQCLLVAPRARMRM